MSLPLFRKVSITADAVVSAVPVLVMKVLVNSNDVDWQLDLTDDGDGTSVNVVELAGQAEGGQTEFSFVDVGGIAFPLVGVYCDLTGASHVTFWLA